MNIHDIYRPFLTHFRRKRLKIFFQAFKIDSSVKLIDVGGSLFFWELAKQANLPVPQVTIVNIHGYQGVLPDYVTWVVTNGTGLPFDDSAFDIAFCNSVIEHVGNWNSQVQFANEIRRVGKSYFVQTPDKAFPFEIHFLTPFIHWLPKNLQKQLARNFTVWGLLTSPSRKQAEEYVDELRLLKAKEMSKLFPDSKIIVEKFFGLSKSIIALKN